MRTWNTDKCLVLACVVFPFFFRKSGAPCLVAKGNQNTNQPFRDLRFSCPCAWPVVFFPWFLPRTCQAIPSSTQLCFVHLKRVEHICCNQGIKEVELVPKAAKHTLSKPRSNLASTSTCQRSLATSFKPMKPIQLADQASAPMARSCNSWETL